MARCPECGIPAGMHHDLGCSLPCDACKKARRRRRLGDLGYVLNMGVVGGLVAWWIWPLFGVGGLRMVSAWTVGLCAGCVLAMGRQRRIERRSRS